MKTESETYKAKLLSKDSKIRNAAIHQLAQSGDAGQLDLLLRVLVDKRIGNGLSTAIKAIGDFQNTAGKNALIEIYGAVNDNDKKLVIAGLLKLGTFEKFFPGGAATKHMQDQLWALLFGLNSAQLKSILALSPGEFMIKLDSAWKSTKHWRK